MLNKMQFCKLAILGIVTKDLQFSVFALCVQQNYPINAIWSLRSLEKLEISS